MITLFLLRAVRFSNICAIPRKETPEGVPPVAIAGTAGLEMMMPYFSVLRLVRGANLHLARSLL